MWVNLTYVVYFLVLLSPLLAFPPASYLYYDCQLTLPLTSPAQQTSIIGPTILHPILSTVQPQFHTYSLSLSHLFLCYPFSNCSPDLHFR